MIEGSEDAEKGGEETLAGMAENAAPAKTSECIVPQTATLAYGGVVDAHNVLAQKLCDLEGVFEALRKSQETSTAAAQEQVAKDAEKWTAQALKAEEDQKKANEQHDAMKALLEERSQGLETKLTQASKDFDDSMEVKLKAVEHSLEEVANRQAEIISRTLPQWEGQVMTQVKKVSSELATHLQRVEERDKQLDVSLDKQQAGLDALSSKLQLQLDADVAALQGKLAATEDALEKLKAELQAATSRSSNRDAELTSELEALGQRLEASFKTEAQAVLAQIPEDCIHRLVTLEGVVKQADFERLSFQHLTEKDLAKLHSAQEAQGTECSARFDSESAKTAEALAQLAKEQQLQLLQARKEFVEGLSTCEKRAQELADGIAGAERRLSGEDGALRDRLQAEAQRLQDFAKAEAKAVLEAIRADEGARLTEAESAMREAELQRRQLGTRITEEQDDRKADVAAAVAVHEKRTGALELVAYGRYESIRQAVDELAGEFQGYVRMQEARDIDGHRLQHLVKALEARVWPWRHKGKDTRDRSHSPHKHEDPAAGEWRGAWPHHAMPPQSPGKYAGPRPGSASYRRRAEEKAWDRDGRDVSDKGLRTWGTAVGPGMSAARAGKSPFQEMSPESTVHPPTSPQTPMSHRDEY